MRIADPSKAPRILDSAAQLFAERPYHEVRMDDIATRAGVAKGTLYLHFRDKEALYDALIDDGMHRQLRQVFARIAEVSDPILKIRDFIKATVEFFDGYPYFLELLPSLEMRNSQTESHPLQSRKTAVLELIRSVLDEFETAGRNVVVDPEFSALCLLGLIYEVLRSHTRPWPVGITDRIEHQFLYGVHGQPN